MYDSGIAGSLLAASSAAMGVRDPVAFDREILRPMIRPASGTLSIIVDGLFGNQGDACVEPLGTTAWASPEMGSNQGAFIANYLAAQLAPDFIERFIDDRPLRGIAPIGDPAAMAALLNSEAFDSEILLQIFSTNIRTYQTGYLYDEPYVIQHNGVGGWNSNSATNVVMSLGETRTNQLIVGATLPISLFSFAAFTDEESCVTIGLAEDSFNPICRIHSDWQGVKIYGREGHGVEAFQGVTNDLIAASPADFSGNLTIERRTGLYLHGSFELTGPAVNIVRSYVFNYTSTGVTSNLVQQEPIGTAVTIQGTFRAPISSFYLRAQRPVTRTINLNAQP